MLFMMASSATYMWPEEDKKVIEVYETFLKEETKRTERLKDAGPTGEPWPKKTKISALDLDRLTTPSKTSERALLVRNCIST